MLKFYEISFLVGAIFQLVYADVLSCVLLIDMLPSPWLHIKDLKMKFADEDVGFWQSYPQDDLALRVAVLHQQRRELAAKAHAEYVNGARFAVASQVITGRGVEVGAGTRPVKVPDGVVVHYGDIRDGNDLQKYFNADVADQGFIDAQTFVGIDKESLDFVISAHVIEHLEDPIGAIVNAMSVLKSGGYYLLIVPDKRFTFDVDRPETPLQHVIEDYADGGRGSRLRSYLEHLQFVHPRFHPPVPAEDMISMARTAANAGDDIHFHCWTRTGFEEVLGEAAKISPFNVEIALTVLNENIFALKKA